MWLGRLRRPLATGALLLAAGCGVRFFERWDGGAEQRRDVAAPPDEVWQRLAGGLADLDGLDLMVEEVRPRDRLIQFAWVTAPGDGREFVECVDTERVGSASLRPRILLEPVEGGTIVIISSEARATTAAACESNGRFERYILTRLDPILAGSPPAPDRTGGERP